MANHACAPCTAATGRSLLWQGQIPTLRIQHRKVIAAAAPRIVQRRRFDRRRARVRSGQVAYVDCFEHGLWRHDSPTRRGHRAPRAARVARLARLARGHARGRRAPRAALVARVARLARRHARRRRGGSGAPRAAHVARLARLARLARGQEAHRRLGRGGRRLAADVRAHAARRGEGPRAAAVARRASCGGESGVRGAGSAGFDSYTNAKEPGVASPRWEHAQGRHKCRLPQFRSS